TSAARGNSSTALPAAQSSMGTRGNPKPRLSGTNAVPTPPSQTGGRTVPSHLRPEPSNAETSLTCETPKKRGRSNGSSVSGDEDDESRRGCTHPGRSGDASDSAPKRSRGISRENTDGSSGLSSAEGTGSGAHTTDGQQWKAPTAGEGKRAATNGGAGDPGNSCIAAPPRSGPPIRSIALSSTQTRAAAIQEVKSGRGGGAHFAGGTKEVKALSSGAAAAGGRQTRAGGINKRVTGVKRRAKTGGRRYGNGSSNSSDDDDPDVGAKGGGDTFGGGAGQAGFDNWNPGDSAGAGSGGLAS
ncbi:unnamed protein product, partial [Sphacelaria rigidula]